MASVFPPLYSPFLRPPGELFSSWTWKVHDPMSLWDTINAGCICRRLPRWSKLQKDFFSGGLKRGHKVWCGWEPVAKLRWWGWHWCILYICDYSNVLSDKQSESSSCKIWCAMGVLALSFTQTLWQNSFCWVSHGWMWKAHTASSSSLRINALGNTSCSSSVLWLVIYRPAVCN